LRKVNIVVNVINDVKRDYCYVCFVILLYYSFLNSCYYLMSDILTRLLMAINLVTVNVETKQNLIITVILNLII